MASSNPVVEAAQPAGSLSQDSEIAHLLTKDVPVDYFGVFHMLVAFIGMTVCTVLILFFDLGIAFPVSLLIYLGIGIAEIRHRIYSPVTLSLITLYVLLYALYLVDSPYLPFFGLGIFAWLAVLCVTLAVLKKPMTTFYTDKHGLMSFHYLISNIWTGAFVLSFVAGFVLMPSVWYLIIPFAVCFVTCLTVIYLNFFDTRFITRREKEFSTGLFSFKQMAAPSKEYDDYINFYTGILMDEVYEKDTAQSERNVAELRQAIRKYDEGKVIFGAYRDGVLIGTIGVSLSSPDRPFPTEEAMECSLDPVRDLGMVVNLGRLCITSRHRESVEVFDGLFKCAIDYALEHDASFIVAEALAGKSMAYARLGFSPLFTRSDPRYNKLSTPSMGNFHVFFNNLAHMIFFQQRSVGAAFNMFNNLNEHLAERWVKRMVVRHAFSRRERLPWMHTIASIRYMLGIKQGKIR